MKKINVMIAGLMMLFILGACKKESIPDITVSEAQALASGNWKVVYYFDNSDSVSNDFDGYEFEISDDGTILATLGASTFSGTWIIKSSDDDPNFNQEIEFTISGNNQMDELDGSWLIMELNETIMNLKDDSGSEEIHFEKN